MVHYVHKVTGGIFSLSPLLSNIFIIISAANTMLKDLQDQIIKEQAGAELCQAHAQVD